MKCGLGDCDFTITARTVPSNVRKRNEREHHSSLCECCSACASVWVYVMNARAWSCVCVQLRGVRVKYISGI